jgi:uncharacterized protein (DUF433 family)
MFPVREEPIPIRFDDDGVARVGQSRVPLQTVIWAFSQGADPEEIVHQFPALNLADVYMTIGYYLQHREEIDQHLQQQRAKTEAIRQETLKRFPQDGLRAKLMARRGIKTR